MALDTFNPYLFVSAGEQSNKFLTPTYAGGIAQFQAQRAQELTGLTVRIEGVQEGTGDPSPDNIRPISGRTGLTVTAAGKNLIGTANTVIGEGYNANGEVETSPNRFRCTPIKCAGQDYVTLSWTAGSVLTQAIRCIWDENGNLLNRTIPSVTISGNTRYYTTNLASFSGAAYIAFAFYADGGASAMDNTSNVMAEFSSTPTNYEVGNVHTYPITWETEAGEVYGGTLDVVSGVLTVDWDYIASYNGETLPGEWISDRDVYAEGTSPTTGAEVAYKLAEPVTYQLDPEQVMTVPGFNQIYSDAGPVIDIKF